MSDENSTEAAAERISNMSGEPPPEPQKRRNDPIRPDSIDPITPDEAVDLIDARNHPEKSEPAPERKPEPEPVAAAPAPLPVMPRELHDARNQVLQEQEKFEAKWAGTDWSRLRQENPAEWAARRQEHNAEQSAIQGRTRQLTAAAEQAVRAQQAEQARQYEQHLAHQRRELARQRPTFEKDRDEVVKYLRDHAGFTESELSSVVDHRLLVMAHDAMKYQNGERKGGRSIRIGRSRQAQPRVSRAEEVTRKQGHSLQSQHHAANRIAEKLGRL